MRIPISEKWLIIIAFGIIYIVWGSTYLANWYAIQEIPPLFMSGSRFLAAGILMYGLSAIFGLSTVTLEHWKNALLSGTMFLVIGTGGMIWAEQYIESAMLALMAAFEPLIVLMLMWGMNNKKPSASGIAGTILGIAGMFFLVNQDYFSADRKAITGACVVFVSLLSWGIASVRLSKLRMPSSKLQGAGMQMLSGGLLLLLISFVSGEAADFDYTRISSRTIYSWLYLVIFGSVIGFSAFNYLLVKSTPDKVATSNYVNPVVAMLLGWGLNNEHITSQSLVAAFLLLVGVIFITTKYQARKEAIPLPHPIASLLREMDVRQPELDVQTGQPTKGAIVRIWEGFTKSETAKDYIEWSKQRCLPECISTPGNLGVTILHQTDGDQTRHYFISYWEDEKALRLFAGNDIHQPKVYPEEKYMLLQPAGRVLHFHL